MQYMLTIYEDQSARAQASEDELGALMDAYMAFGQEGGQDPAHSPAVSRCVR